MAAAQVPPAIQRALIFPLPGAFIDSALGRVADRAGQGIVNFPLITVRGTAAQERLHARRLIYRGEHVCAALCADGQPSQSRETSDVAHGWLLSTRRSMAADGSDQLSCCQGDGVDAG